MGTSSNVIVGVAQLYVAPANTATPVFASSGLVTPPTSPWVAQGFSESGVTLTVDRKVTEIHAEEQSTPIIVVPDTTGVTIDITLIEDLLANANVAYGGATLTTTAATLTTPATTVLTLAEAMATYALAAIGLNPFGLSRLIYIPSVYSAGKVKTEYKRTKTERMYPVTFTAACPVTSIVTTDATAPHS